MKICCCSILITTLKDKICNYLTLISKHMCIDKLDNIVNKHNKYIS